VNLTLYFFIKRDIITKSIAVVVIGFKQKKTSLDLKLN
jgi:hypothetical protein